MSRPACADLSTMHAVSRPVRPGVGAMSARSGSRYPDLGTVTGAIKLDVEGFAECPSLALEGPSLTLTGPFLVFMCMAQNSVSRRF